MTEENQLEGQVPSEEDRPPSPEKAGTETPTDEAALIREQLEEALREKDQFRAMAQRSQAALINFKRRTAEEHEDRRRAANSQLILNMLSIVDDLDRALEHAPEDADDSGWVDGVRLVRRNLGRVLESEGVAKIDAVGKSFEPWEHEAVFYEETPDAPEGLVVRVIREGYKLHDKVLRAAQVTVSRAPEPQDESTTTQEET